MEHTKNFRIEMLKANGYTEECAVAITLNMTKEEIALWKQCGTFAEFYEKLRNNPSMNRSTACNFIFKTDKG